MSLIVNIVLAVLIFGYTFYALVRFFKRSKAGKCASCELEKICECESETHLPDHLK
ncbi:FeoB-associated Cys-rich membrane protein [Listeria costaricensis]|uniref:FeoB-associated Cys-rich membrane protein n=1 Tax=Listeria costaricensis TaxID=2026604 RepID=UPI000C069766|nr:FeoB-associated Cys-rich membrane protein [Listeria costaricensis]